MKRLLSVGFLSLLIALASASASGAGSSSSQDPAESSSNKAGQRNADSIEGRVISDDGQPIVKAQIWVIEAGQSSRTVRWTKTDREGKFRAEGLAPMQYRISADAPGYLLSNESSRPKSYSPGDFVNITMIKGGVITGTVTDSSGKPVVAVPVSIIFVRTSDGRSLGGVGGAARPRYTDDRGVYRIYGLSGGSYLVMAGMRPGSNAGLAVRYRDHSPTYFPSATRETAQEVRVDKGREVTGIDIRYRAERGYSISGTVSGAVPSDTESGHVSLTLLYASSGLTEAMASISGKDDSFTFDNVTEGEYELIAQSNLMSGENGVSAPVRVKVSGADVKGLKVILTPFSSIAGRTLLEPLQDAALKSGCRDEREGLLRNMRVIVRPDSVIERRDQPPPPGRPRSVPARIDDKGEFEIQRLHAELYRVETQLWGRSWYVRSITLPGGGQNRRPFDVARNGIALKAGERVKRLTVTIAEGAASLDGQVLPSVEGNQLPARLRVHLVPSDREHADDTLRFAEARVRNDDSFIFSNLAPGRYLIVIDQASASDEESMEIWQRHAAWDGVERERLRRLAEACSTAIELQPCRSISHYKLFYAPPQSNKNGPSKKGQ
ncbi:MAG: carboxypeptidase-like regulatory domain-containing protein [Blastocatellia bacterium]|nr:carboxypeptidase-like regulatory domain-containing protein [Blastocatellia bacterium]